MAKIVNHASGLGAPSPETVRERALELARIDGREDFTEEDWQQAKIELHGGMALSGNGDDEMVASFSERDMIAVNVGHHVENIRYDDSDSVIEELVAEGLEEAVHDQMLEASRALAEADRDADL